MWTNFRRGRSKLIPSKNVILQTSLILPVEKEIAIKMQKKKYFIFSFLPEKQHYRHRFVDWHTHHAAHETPFCHSRVFCSFVNCSQLHHMNEFMETIYTEYFLPSAIDIIKISLRIEFRIHKDDEKKTRTNFFILSYVS